MIMLLLVGRNLTGSGSLFEKEIGGIVMSIRNYVSKKKILPTGGIPQKSCHKAIK
jgi:hypothetical protein